MTEQNHDFVNIPKILSEIENLEILLMKDEYGRIVQITNGGDSHLTTKFELIEFQYGLEKAVHIIRTFLREWGEFLDDE